MPLVAAATTTLEAGLYDYLTRQSDYTGHAAKPFRAPLKFDGMTLTNRNDARRELRSRLGNRVFLDRRPEDAGDATSCVIRWLNGQNDYGLAGETAGSEAFLELTVYASGQDAARRGGTVYGLLHTALSGYHAGYFGDVLIGECLVDAARTLASPPPDASDRWTFTRRMNASVYYYAANTPEYSAYPLTAYVSATVTPTEIRLDSTSSLIAEGIKLTTVAWQFRTSAGGSPILSISGAPGALPATAGVSGTFAAPSIALATHTSLAGQSVYVTMTLTDASGETSTTTTTVTT